METEVSVQLKQSQLKQCADKSPPVQPIELNYAYSNVVAEIDQGIRDTIKGIRLSILAMGIGLARIKEKRLYVDLNFRSMNRYIEQLCMENKMERSSIFNWLSIGEAYLKYRSDLEKIGFNDDDGPTKLPYIDRALEKKQKQEVFENIKTMSVREFKAFSSAKTETAAEKRDRIQVRGNEVYIGGKRAITLSEELDRTTYTFFTKVILTAGKVVEEGGVVLPVHLRDMDEVRRLKPLISQLIKKMRKKSQSNV